MQKVIGSFPFVVAVVIPSAVSPSHPGKYQRGAANKLGPVSCIRLETACLLNRTNFSLPFSCPPHSDEAHFWNSRACTNQVHIPLLQREKRLSGGFVKEEHLFHLVRDKVRRGSFALAEGYITNSSIGFSVIFW